MNNFIENMYRSVRDRISQEEKDEFLRECGMCGNEILFFDTYGDLHQYCQSCFEIANKVKEDYE